MNTKREIIHSKYERLIAVLFFGSTIASLIRSDLITPILWLLCAYLYLFKVDPFKNLFTRILTTLNLICLLLGYALFLYQVTKPFEMHRNHQNILGITIVEKK